MRYHPIDCGLYDHLEALATLKKRVPILFRSPEGQTREGNYRIATLITREKEEFVVLENDEEIRLDRLISVDGKEFSGISCKK